jgi:hypothetical protein
VLDDVTICLGKAMVSGGAGEDVLHAEVRLMGPWLPVNLTGVLLLAFAVGLSWAYALPGEGVWAVGALLCGLAVGYVKTRRRP